MLTSAEPGPAPEIKPTLVSRLEPGVELSPDEILDRFLEWVSELGFELFPAQEEALLELMAGRHVVLNTPTGSGKSLVATGLHFKVLCEGGRSFYTSPIKALANEKFFDLCQTFGAENVGMLTGDASINAEAPILCCTAEVLSNLALRRGSRLNVDAVVMDEFHYYSDEERGVAWQVPLIALPDVAYLLMSATLGNTAKIREHLERRSGREVALVSSQERPVPLEFEYRETPIHETVQDLSDQNRAPIYVVSFTQRECAELAQSLTSLTLSDREHRQRLKKVLAEHRFDTAYGREMRRFLGFGIGVHHAGLLPKYRLLVEKLSQRGLLRVVCGTDTLGVGVNIPIRTVLFRKLCKYDGTKTTILSVRDFLQIAGRAGRKGFDDRGWVVCQAPEHVIENLRLQVKARENPKKAKKLIKKKPPQRGFVPWDRRTFEQLCEKPPEMLRSRFRVTHGTVLSTIQADTSDNDPERGNFASLRELIGHCHDDEDTKRGHLGEATQLVRSLYRAGVLNMTRDSESNYFWVTQDDSLQITFSLHQTLSLFLIAALDEMDIESSTYALDALSLVEAILENPTLILRRQVDRERDRLIARLKADGVPYEERMKRLEEVTWPKPNAESIYERFGDFRHKHPWVGHDNVRPKGIAREIWEGYLSFGDFVREYGLQRAEGLLLRYLSQLYKVLTQTVPDPRKTEEIWDLLGFFRTMLARVDTSLIEEWERLLDPETGISKLAGTDEGQQALKDYELLGDPRAFLARIRAELHQLVRALAQQDWEEAALSVRQPLADDEDELAEWAPERFEAAMAPYFEEYEQLIFTPQARHAHLTLSTETGHGRHDLTHTLLDPAGDNLWCIEGEVRLDIDDPALAAARGESARPLLRVRRIGK